MLRCEKCKHYNCEADKYPCAECDSNVNDLFEEKKQTNADRIRAMSDEELADFLCKVKADYQWAEPDYPREDACGDWEEWLQSEVEG